MQLKASGHKSSFAIRIVRGGIVCAATVVVSCVFTAVGHAESPTDWAIPWQVGPESRDVVTLGTPSVTQDIAQTRDGYLWFASMNGLYRYDGDRLVDVALGHAGQSARRLLASRDGGLWVATGGGYLDPAVAADKPFNVGFREGAGGLSFLKSGEMIEVLPPDGKAEHWVWSLAELRDGRLAIGTEDGVWLLSRGQTNARRLPLSDREPGHVSSLLVRNEQGEEVLWIVTAAGVWRWRTQHADAPQKQFPMVGARDLAPTSSDFWIIQDTQLFLVENGAITKTLTGAPGEQMRSVLSSKTEATWVGTTFGLKRIRNGALEPAVEALPQQSVRALFRDREGSVWAAVKGLGVAQMRVAVVKNLGREEGLPADTALSVLPDVADPRHRYWVMTTAGLAKIQDGKIDLHPLHNVQLDWRLRNLAQERDGTLWLGFDRLVRLRKKETSEFGPEALGAEVRAVFVDENDLWVGLSNGSALRFANGDTDQAPDRFSKDTGFCPGPIQRISAGADTVLWFVGPGGATRYDKEPRQGRCVKLESQDADRLQDVPVATDVAQDDNGTAWITAVGNQGLFRFKDGVIKPVPAISGFLPTSLYGLLLDDAKNAWFSSYQGVFRLRLEDLERWIDGQGSLPVVFHVDHDSGMRSSDCQSTFTPSLISWNHGGILVTTALGLSAIKPPEALPQPQVEPVIESVNVDGRPLSPAEAVLPGSRRIDILFNAPTFLAAPRLHFQQRLDGIDDRWRDVGDTRAAQFIDLKPGDYTFRVRLAIAKAGTNRAAWVSFRVLAPWYQRWPMTLAALLMVSLFLFLAYRMRLARLSAHFTTIANERNRIARDWHDGLSQVFLGIGYQLEALRMRLGANKSSTVDPAVAIILDDTKAMVKDAQEGVKTVLWDLRADQDNNRFLETFRALADETKKRFGVMVLIHTTGPLPPAGDITREWILIATEAVTNAVKHGQAKNIRIALAFSKTEATLAIEDDGTGVLVQPDAQKRRVSFGLVGMQERAARCGGQLFLEPGDSVGTRVRVVVQWRSNG